MNWIHRFTNRTRNKQETNKESLTPEEKSSIKDLEKRLCYSFRDKSLLLRAITHPSLGEDNRGTEDNQRLEFLGDSILGAILAERLFQLFPDDNEGILTQGKSVLARGDYLAGLARRLGIHKAIRMSKSEIRDKGNERNSTLEDAMEAVVAAVYLDGGMRVTRKTVLNWYGDMEKTLASAIDDYNPKGRLQELSQALHGPDQIRYVVEKESGPAHQKHYTISVRVSNRRRGTGSGKSKKEAEEEAARKALRSFSRKPSRRKKGTRKTNRRNKNNL